MTSDHRQEDGNTPAVSEDCEDFLVQVTDLCVEQCNTNGKLLLSKERAYSIKVKYVCQSKRPHHKNHNHHTFAGNPLCVKNQETGMEI